MKNRKLILISAVALLVSMTGCSIGYQNPKQPEKTFGATEKTFGAKIGRFDMDFKIVIIDSCEYLYTDAGSSGQCIFHKGNCKFCIKRNKK